MKLGAGEYSWHLRISSKQISATWWFLPSSSVIPHRRSTTRNENPFFLQRSRISGNTSPIRSFLTLSNLLKVELIKIRIVLPIVAASCPDNHQHIIIRISASCKNPCLHLSPSRLFPPMPLVRPAPRRNRRRRFLFPFPPVLPAGSFICAIGLKSEVNMKQRSGSQQPCDHTYYANTYCTRTGKDADRWSCILRKDGSPKNQRNRTVIQDYE